jgi:hypothetical protein
MRLQSSRINRLGMESLVLIAAPKATGSKGECRLRRPPEDLLRSAAAREGAAQT